MKVVYALLLVCLFPILTQGQDTVAHANKFMYLGPTVGYPWFGGDNFLRHTYRHQPSIAFELGFNIYRRFGLGTYARYHRGTVQTTEYVGNSIGGDIKEAGILALYLVPINEKWLFIPKIGIGSFWLTNRLESSSSEDYRYTSEGKLYSVRPTMNYFFNDRISIFSAVEYGYVDLSRIRVTREMRHVYQGSHQFHLSAGVRLWILKH
ncbi:hypothetical protein [Parapedobacter sp. DT-150]|uniref:hypothetical protein n=1 Tax=Parapedobacter sp. DT-150 TaxID=3396162 RepID=UPI003F1D5552